MSEIKVNSIKGVGASAAAITVNNTDGTCTANLTNRTNKNLIINGAMQVAQRGTSSTTSGYGSLDRFACYFGGTDEAVTHAQVDIASGTTPYTLGFRKALKITNGNQTSGAGADDNVQIQTRFEAQDIAQSGWNYTSASSFITLSFWVKSSVAQNFYGYLRTKDGTSQRYPFETGSLSADTWTKITKTILGNSNLQFDNNNENGLELVFGAFFGTGFTDSGVSLNTWGAYSGSTRTPDYTSTWYTTNDATFEITGVQLEVSDHATSFEHRSFGQELALCQRYCQIFGGVTNFTLFGSGVWKSSTAASIGIPFFTQMRATPSFSVATPTSSMIRSGGSNIDATSVALDVATRDNVMYNANASSGGTNGHGAMHLGKGDTDTTITLSAEL